MNKISVLLADDYTFIREGLRALLEAEEDIVVVGEAETGLEAVQLARELLPEVVIMDIAMPVLTGVEATRQIKRMLPDIRVLALSAHSDDKFVRQMTEAGATGYLLKQTSVGEVIKAVREARQGRTFFSPAITARLAVNDRGRFSSGAPAPCCMNKLTPREAEVLQLVAEGYATKGIARELCVSIGTIVKQRQQVMNKLNLHNIAALTRYAISEGMIQAAPNRDRQTASYTPRVWQREPESMASIPDQTAVIAPFNLVAAPAAIYPARFND